MIKFKNLRYIKNTMIGHNYSYVLNAFRGCIVARVSGSE